MDKVERLLRRMRDFRDVLNRYAERDSALQPIQSELQVLFDRIEAGDVKPPVTVEYRWPFHIDDERYGFRSELSLASSAFRAALEDWRSKPWSKGLYDDESADE